MVIQRAIRETGGKSLKKNVKAECEQGEQDVFQLAGKEEVLALHFLQSQFLAKAAKQANHITFQERKTKVNQSTVRRVMKSTLQECTPYANED